MNDRVRVPTVWAIRHFTRHEIARALRKVNAYKWSTGAWTPTRSTVLDADGSRTMTDAPRPAMNDAAWHAHLAQLKAARNKNVLSLTPRASARKEA